MQNQTQIANPTAEIGDNASMTIEFQNIRYVATAQEITQARSLWMSLRAEVGEQILWIHDSLIDSIDKTIADIEFGRASEDDIQDLNENLCLWRVATLN